MMKPAHPPRKLDIALVFGLEARLHDLDALGKGHTPELIGKNAYSVGASAEVVDDPSGFGF